MITIKEKTRPQTDGNGPSQTNLGPNKLLPLRHSAANCKCSDDCKGDGVCDAPPPKLESRKLIDNENFNVYLNADVLSIPPNSKGKIKPNFRSRFVNSDLVKIRKRNTDKSYKNDGWIRDLTMEGIEANPGPVCFNCGDEGHMKNMCAKEKKLLCSLCSKPGHFRKDCPKKTNDDVPELIIKCGFCGKPGHLKKDCRASNSSKGGRSSARNSAIASSIRKTDAEQQGHIDGLREKIKEMKELKDDKEIEAKVVDSTPAVNKPTNLSFDVSRTENVNAPHLVFLLVMWRFFAFFALSIFVFDQLFWNPFVFYASKFVCLGYGYFVGVVTGGVLFWGQNLVMLVVAASMGLAGYLFRSNFEYNRRFILTNKGEFVPRSLDNRPASMSTQKVLLDRNYASVTEKEFYTIKIPFFNTEVNYGSNVIDEFNIDAVAFTESASLCHSSFKKEEIKDRTRKELAKFSKLDWDKTDMAQDMLLEKTCYVLDYYHSHVLQFRDRKRTFFSGYVGELTDFDDKLPFMFEKWYGKLACFMLLICILYCLSAWYFIITVDVYSNLSSAVKSCTILASSLYYNSSFTVLPCTESVVVPSGVSGYKITDAFASSVSDNIVGANKDFSFRYTDTAGSDKLMAIFSPFCIPGLAMPLSDRDDPITTAAGLAHRGGGDTPKPDKNWMIAKAKIAYEVCSHYFKPLSDSDLLSVPEALNKTAYTVKRKSDILMKHVKGFLFDKYRKVRETAMFNKYEPYPKAKHSRSIQGMHDRLWDSDVFGTMGVLVKTMEQYVYVLPACVKHMTASEQVDKLLSLGPGSKTVSDYSSYEASFSDEVKESAQFVLYDYMVQNLSDCERYKDYYRWLLSGANKIDNKHIQAQISNLKCSGDFDTALSNYWDNVITWCTVFQMKFDVPWVESIEWFLCEGDDNITDDRGFVFEASDFAKLGMKAKIETNLTLEEAGFCQKFVSPRTKNLLCDPVRFLGKRQYLDVKYQKAGRNTHLSLLRATAMSALSMYPNAPVVSEWAWKVYELTEGVVVRKKHMLDMVKNYTVSSIEVFNGVFSPPTIDSADRISVSWLFDFSLAKQEEFTVLLNEWAGGFLELPLWWFPEDWVDFYQVYSGKPGSVFELCVERYNDVVSWLEPHRTNSSV